MSVRKNILSSAMSRARWADLVDDDEVFEFSGALCADDSGAIRADDSGAVRADDLCEVAVGGKGSEGRFSGTVGADDSGALCADDAPEDFPYKVKRRRLRPCKLITVYIHSMASAFFS